MGLVEDPRLHVKLTGSWETSVGDQDTYFHILEYENYGGYDNTTQLVRTTEVCSGQEVVIFWALLTSLLYH